MLCHRLLKYEHLYLLKKAFIVKLSHSFAFASKNSSAAGDFILQFNISFANGANDLMIAGLKEVNISE